MGPEKVGLYGIWWATDDQYRPNIAHREHRVNILENASSCIVKTSESHFAHF